MRAWRRPTSRSTPAARSIKNSQATYIENLTLNGNGAVINAGAAGNDNLQLCGDVTATSTAAGAPSISSLNLVAGTYTDAGNTRTFNVVHGAGSTSTVDLTIGGIGQQTSDATNQKASLVKTGNGTLALSGNSTYTGDTMVNNGTLRLDGSLTSAITVNDGATLQGSGSSTGGLIMNSNSTLAPGNSIQKLSMGSVTFKANSTLAYELDSSEAAAEAFANGDLLLIGGDVTIESGAILALSELGTSGAWTRGEKLTLINYSGNLSGQFLWGVGGDPMVDNGIYTFNSVSWQVRYNDQLGAGSNFVFDATNNKFLTLTVIPEPGTAGVVATFLAAALLRMRRRAE